MITRGFLLGLLDRVIKAAILGASAYLGDSTTVDIFTINWKGLLGAVGGSVLMSVILTFGSLPLGDPGTTSAIRGAR
jgi:hypothetical protein